MFCGATKWRLDLVGIKVMPICYVKPVVDESVRQLCRRPYPNHLKGCPNYGKRPTCPPQAPMLSEVFDLTKPVLAVWQPYNLALHREKMREKHPNWSRRQLDCCLYWQGKMNKRLRQEVKYNLTRYRLFENNKNLTETYAPEAMGANVTETMKNADVILEWPPVNIVIKVAFVGVGFGGAKSVDMSKAELRVAIASKQAEKEDAVLILAAVTGVPKDKIVDFLKTGEIDDLSYQILVSLA